MELELCTTLSFNSASKNRWQTAYISQLYGTLFVVYVKINYDEELKTLKEVELLLKNYKGGINLGIKNVKYVATRKTSEVTELNFSVIPKIINIISIKLDIQALSSDTKEYDKIEKIDLELDQTGPTYYLEINRKLLPMNDKDGEYNKNGVFDSEFYYKDGFRPPEKINREYHDAININPTYDVQGRRVDDNGEIIPKNDIPNLPKGPGGICPKSYSLITF